MKESDLFVYLDDVQYEKNYFQNRNKLVDKEGNVFYATVPLRKSSSSKKINEKKILFPDYTKKYLNKIYDSYNKTPFFNDFFERFKSIILYDHENLADLNISIISWMKEILGIKTSVIRSSQITYAGKKSDLNLSICCELKATKYLTGMSGFSYLNIESFKKNKIEIIEHNPQIKSYQCKNYIAGMSSFDLIMNHGENSFKYI